MWKQSNNNGIAAEAAATATEAADSGASGGSNNNDNNKKHCESFSVFFLIRNCKAKQKTGKRVIFYCSLLAYVAVAMSPTVSLCMCVCCIFFLTFGDSAFLLLLSPAASVDDAGADVDADVAAELLAF